jgi:hypothetical protein
MKQANWRQPKGPGIEGKEEYPETLSRLIRLRNGAENAY